MKKYVYLLLATMLCISFVSCEKDGDDGKDADLESILLVGTWNLYKSWDDHRFYDETGYHSGFRFDANGKGFWYENGYDIMKGERQYFTWECANSVLTIYYDEGAVQRATIKQIDHEELILSYNKGFEKEYYHRAN
ncbi:MAG: lipocalin family protein [Alistipes sp.]|nr:lipocalin family protein [Alistipes sp.]